MELIVISLLISIVSIWILLVILRAILSIRRSVEQRDEIIRLLKTIEQQGKT